MGFMQNDEPVTKCHRLNNKPLCSLSIIPDGECVMSEKDEGSVVSYEAIQGMIFIIRGKKVMFDRDLAKLYGVETKQLKRAVRRNIERFPDDFMFQLSGEEFDSLRCHFGTLKRGAHAKYLSYVFTEQGVAMLSSVLNSKRAIQVNIAIMRVFTKLRDLVSTHKELAQKMAELERKVGGHDKDINAIINIIRKLMQEPVKKEKGIGFHTK